jgi:hypothetical protein
MNGIIVIYRQNRGSNPRFDQGDTGTPSGRD